MAVRLVVATGGRVVRRRFAAPFQIPGARSRPLRMRSRLAMMNQHAETLPTPTSAKRCRCDQTVMEPSGKTPARVNRTDAYRSERRKLKSGG